ncbi:MAG: recombinase family protein [Phycisphaeraceae bacterium]
MANTTAYSYIRFSSKKQADGDSLRRQTEGADRYCSQNSLRLDHSLTLHDLGVSAFSGQNATEGKLGAFIGAVDAGRVAPGSTLILESLDRMSRQEVIDSLELFLGLIRRGIRIVTLTPEDLFERDTLDTMRLITAIMVMARAHEESAIKANRATQAWDAKRKVARAGKGRIHSNPPTWLDVDGDRYVVNKKRSAVAQRMVRMSLDGAGPLAIARAFNATNVPTFTDRSTKWHVSTVRGILRSRALIGEYQPRNIRAGKRTPNGNPITGYYPALLDEDVFYRLQAAMDRRSTSRRGRIGKRVANLFGRILTNGHDGGVMRISSKRANSVIMQSVHANDRVSSTPSFPYPVFEYHILAWLTEVDLWERPIDNGEIDAQTGRLAEIRAKIEQLRQKLTSLPAGDQFGVLIDMLASLSSEEAEMEAKIERLRLQQHAPRPSSRHVLDLVQQLKENEEARAKRQPRATEIRSASAAIREKLRTEIANVVEQIKAYTYASRRLRRLCIADIRLRDGTRHVVIIRKVRGEEPISVSTGLPIEDRRSFSPDRMADRLLAATSHEEFRRAASRSLIDGFGSDPTTHPPCSQRPVPQ